MKPGFLFVALLGAAPTIYAQNDVAPPLVAPLVALDEDLVRRSDYIGWGELDVKTEAANTTVRFKYPGYKTLQGDSALMARGMRTGEKLSAPGPTLVFARYDVGTGRVEILRFAEANEANLRAVNAWIAANPKVEITLETSKTAYALGEPIVARYRVKNLTATPISLYTGESATEASLGYGGSSRSSTDVVARKRPAFTPLAAGQTWEYERSFPGPFPEGEVRISLSYDWRDALERTRQPIPENVVFVRKTRELRVSILPADQKQLGQLELETRAVAWNRQLGAAEVLFASQSGLASPAARALFHHPWSKIRALAA